MKGFKLEIGFKLGVKSGLGMLHFPGCSAFAKCPLSLVSYPTKKFIR